MPTKSKVEIRLRQRLEAIDEELQDAVNARDRLVERVSGLEKAKAELEAILEGEEEDDGATSSEC